MKKFKIGIIGHFGGGKVFLDGQTIKTKILYQEILEQIKQDCVDYIDTFNWKKNIFTLVFKSLAMTRKSENIIIVLSNKGRNVFIPLLYVFGIIFNTDIHAMIIGGKFADDMKEKYFSRFFSKRINSICVETNKMEADLISLGYKNVFVLPNFKKLKKVNLDKVTVNTKPIKLCTFSRVCEEKGIEDIIEAVEYINNKYNKEVYCLDIYGQIEKDYEERFQHLINNSNSYIRYMGIVDYDKSVDIIKEYTMLAFPTYFHGEGFPGTVIDSYFAGVPILASDWKHNKEVIKEEITGILYEAKNIKMLIEKLEFIMKNTEYIISMKSNCIRIADEYSSEKVVKKYLKSLDIK